MTLFPNEIPLEKTKFLFVSGYQLEMASRLGGSLCLLFFSALGPHLAQTRAGPVHAPVVSVGSYVHWSWWFRRLFFLGLLCPLWVLHSSHFLFPRILWALWRIIGWSYPFLELSGPRSLTLYISASCGSLSLVPSAARSSTNDESNILLVKKLAMSKAWYWGRLAIIDRKNSNTCHYHMILWTQQ